MYISEIKITRYKSIISDQVLTPDLTSVFIGANNSGKSTYLDALYRFFRPVQHPERYFDSDAHVEMHCVFDGKDLAEIGKLHPALRQPHITCILTGDSLFVKTADEHIPMPKSFSLWLTKHSIRISALRDLDYVKMQKLVEEFANGWPKAFKLFLSTLQNFFPDIKTPKKLFTQKGDSFITQVKEFGEQRNIERLGLGFQHLFIMLIYLFHPRYHVILIDEPEIHQHPSIVKRLAKLMYENAPKKQLCITTHSPAFVLPHSLHQVYRVARDSNHGTCAYHIKKDTGNAFRLAQELNDDTNEMFFADKVVLVEGVSDRLFIRTLLDRFFSSSQYIKIIPVHGKENFSVYCDILTSFHIPVFVICDQDAKTVAATLIERFGKFACNVFTLPNGPLEAHIPKSLRKDDTLTKPLQALHAATQLNEAQLQEEPLLPIYSILDHIMK